MKLIACVEDRYGMLFNQRRVSRDVAVSEKILSLIGDRKLWIHPYSEALFPCKDALCPADDFMDKAHSDDWCFLENADVTPWLSRVTELILFRWNRKYPYDLSFPFDTCFSQWSLVCREDFPGNSHDTVTMEVYRP